MIFNSFFVFLSFIISFILAYDYKTLQVPVKVDHFSFANDDKFNITVLLNDSYWEDPVNGPIFAYLGGEDSIEAYVKDTGFIWEAAEQCKALIVYIEHRFYGKSLPYGNKSTTEKKYFGYLTVKQTLRDFVDVLFYVDSEIWRGVAIDNPETVIKHPIITLGGSYGGQLAVYLRANYPFVVAGSLGASATILQLPGLVDCESYHQTITEIFAIDYPTCPSLVMKTREAFYTITSNGSSVEGNKWLTDTLKLCQQLTNSEDVLFLNYWIQEIIWKIALANYPYAHNMLMPLPGYPVKVFCSKLVETTEEPHDLVNAMFNAVNSVANYTGQVKCFGYNDSTSDSSDSSEVVQFSPWSLQSCMELVWPVCGDGIHDMFMQNTWNLTAVSDDCYNSYKVRPRVDQLKMEYGGWHLEAASDIVISNGLLDPWKRGIPMTSIPPSVITVILQNCAHHLDLMASNEKDPKEVIQVRKLYVEYFQIWMKEFYDRK